MGFKDFFFRDVSIRRVVVLPTIILVTVFTFASGYLATRSGEKAVRDVSASLRREIAWNIGARLFRYMSAPETVCRSAAALIKAGLVYHEDPEELQTYFLTQLHFFPEVSSIYFGTTGGQVYCSPDGGGGFPQVLSGRERRQGPFPGLCIPGFRCQDQVLVHQCRLHA